MTDHKTLIDDWKTKNKDKIIKLEELRDSAVSADRIKKNYALWSKGDKESETRYQTMSIWVLNPDTVDEVAYFEGTEPLYTTPSITPPKSLRELVSEYIKKQSILGGVIKEVDEGLNTIIAEVYLNTTKKETWLCKKGTLGSIEHYIVSSI